MIKEQVMNLNTIIETYGMDPQVDMAIEECSELQKALLKYRRKAKTNPGKEELKKLKADIVDELADVSIMVEQIKCIFNCHMEVENEIEYKINRQMQRIKEDNSKTLEEIYEKY